MADSGPIPRDELRRILIAAGIKEAVLTERLNELIYKLLKWADDIADPKATAVDVELHCRGKRVTSSVRKLDN